MTAKFADSSWANFGIGPNDRLHNAPSTRMIGSPLPDLLNEIAVPSFEITLLIGSPSAFFCDSRPYSHVEWHGRESTSSLAFFANHSFRAHDTSLRFVSKLQKRLVVSSITSRRSRILLYLPNLNHLIIRSRA